MGESSFSLEQIQCCFDELEKTLERTRLRVLWTFANVLNVSESEIIAAATALNMSEGEVIVKGYVKENEGEILQVERCR